MPNNLGQSLCLDNIARDLLNSGTRKRFIDELSATDNTSNPTIFNHHQELYGIRRRDPRGIGEDVVR